MTTDTDPGTPSAPEGVEEFTTVESIFVRGRNCLLLTADFSPLFVDYYLHLMQHGMRNEEPVDVQATLMMLTARTITDAVKKFARQTQEIYLCGGGALNGALAQMIRQAAGDDMYVRSTSVLGVDPMHVEAMAFAWFAWAFLNRIPGNLPEVTNATGSRILGALYPH